MAFTNGNDTAVLQGPGRGDYDFLGGIDTLDMGDARRPEYTFVKLTDGTVKIDSMSGASGGGLHITVKNLELVKFNDGTGTIDLRTFFGATTTTLLGGANNDVFAPASGLWAIDGQGGIDKLVLSQAALAYTVAPSTGGFVVTARDNSATYDLKNVERVQFTSTKLALDVAGNAGTTAKILGAVFGAPSVAARPDYVGIGLGLLDGGMTYEALMQLALDAALGTGATPKQVVDLLYTNVVGVAPPTDAEAFYVGLINDHTYTAATLGVMAADTDLNKLHIDLMGLAQTGIVYSGG